MYICCALHSFSTLLALCKLRLPCVDNYRCIIKSSVSFLYNNIKNLIYRRRFLDVLLESVPVLNLKNFHFKNILKNNINYILLTHLII
jgi:hypothetical protein